MGFVVFHLDKSPGREAAMTDHIERNVIPSNADPKRTHLNKELIEFPEEVTNRTEAIQYRLETAELNRKIGKNQVQVLRIMLSAGKDDMKRIQDTGKLDEWCKDNLDYLKKTFGIDNVVSAVLHLDETTPHIHASVVPIVQGERRQKKPGKKEVEQSPKKKYKKKDANRPRLCADDLTCKVKLIEYQDTYAEVMKKYGLERGIKGSEARHITLTEYYRNQAVQSKNLQENIELLLAEEDAKRLSIEQLKREEQEVQRQFEQTDTRIQQKESELKQTEENLNQVKGQLKTEELKSKVADVGSNIMDGIGSLVGTSKVKRLEAQNGELKLEIETLQEEKESIRNQAQKEITEKDRTILEKDSLITSQKSKLDKLFDYIPVLNEYDFIVRLCETIKLPTSIVKQIFAGKEIGYTGKLYSPEHKQDFDADNIKIAIGRTAKDNKPVLAIEGMNYLEWFKQKYRKLQEAIGIKLPKHEANKSKGFRM